MKCRILGVCLLATLLSGCGKNYGVAELSAALSRLPGVRVNSVVGNDADWPFGPTDYTVDLTVGANGHLVLCGVPRNNLNAPRSFRLAAVGQWNPEVFGPQDAGRMQYVAGCPNSVEVGPGATLGLLIPGPLQSVEDVIYAYPVLEATIASWPNCCDVRAPSDSSSLWCCKSAYKVP